MLMCSARFYRHRFPEFRHVSMKTFIFVSRIACNQHFAGLPGGRVDGPSLVPGGLVLQLDGNGDDGAPACAVCACCNST